MINDEEQEQELEEEQETKQEKHWFEMPDDISRDIREMMKRDEKARERAKLQASLEHIHQVKRELEARGFLFQPVNDKGKLKITAPDGKEFINYLELVSDKLEAMYLKSL